MKWRNKELGLWSLYKGKKFSVEVTTPRHAGYVSLEFLARDSNIIFFVGKHIGVEYSFKTRCGVHEWKPRVCKCYGCRMRQPLSPQIIAAIREKYNAPDFGRKVRVKDDE